MLPPLLIGPWFYMASNVAPASTLVIAPLLISLAKIFNAPQLTDMAIIISTQTGSWWFYVIYVTFCRCGHAPGHAILCPVAADKFYYRVACTRLLVQLCFFLPAALNFRQSSTVLWSEALQWGNHDAYQQILERAEELGYTAKPLSETTARSSFLIGPALAYTFMYVACTSLLAGEIRGVYRLKNAFTIFLGGNLFSMVVCAGFMWLLISRLSNEFFTSANFLWATGQARDIPVPPQPHFS